MTLVLSKLANFGRSLLLVLLVLNIVSYNMQVYALSDPDERAIYGPWTQWVQDSCTPKCSSDSNIQIRLPTISDPTKAAEAINSYILKESPDSPFNGLGASFISGGTRTGINPLLAVAQAKVESGLGTTGVATNGSNNAFGRTATANQPGVETSRRWYKWSSFEKSLVADAFPASGNTDQPDDWFQYITRRLGGALDNFDKYLDIYAPAGENDQEAYTKAVSDIINEIVQASAGSIQSTGSGAADQPKSCICQAETVTANPIAPMNEIGIDPESGFSKLNPSPFSGNSIQPTGVVLHWTGGSPSQSVEDFVSVIGGRDLSVQLYIDGKGTVYQLVDKLNTLTAHAQGANSKTIGIEIAAGSDGTVATAEEEINGNQVQKQAVVQAVSYLLQKFNIPIQGDVSNLTGVLSHHLISPGRKSDTGDRYLQDIRAALEGGGNLTGGAQPCAGATIGGGGDPEANKVLGQKLAAQAGFTESEWACLLDLWTRESGWNHNESEPNSNNPISSAYGIPQALIGAHREGILKDYAGYYEKEISNGSGDADNEYTGGNPEVQIKWGLDYIKGKYRTPCVAVEYHDAHNSY